MRLYLVQHGESIPEQLDPDRPLSDKGKADVSKAANFLKQYGIKIDIIWHSTKLRAKQTARLMAEVISPQEGILEKRGLAPNDPVAGIKMEILKEKQEDIMVVGHLPFLSKLASLFLINDESYQVIGFQQGSVVCMEQKEDEIWSVRWMVIPELIKE
jgi:phosphohistidine phosphatase